MLALQKREIISLTTPSEISSIHTIRHWLALYCTPGIGPIKFFQLLKIFPHVEDIFKASTEKLSKLNLSSITIDALKNTDWKVVEDNLRWADQENNHILLYIDPRYPLLLQQIAAPPPLLFVQGDITMLQSYQLAIVGSRNPTPTGKDIAQQFAGYLSEVDLTITSGLALGIDAESHRGALKNKGKTIAVLGTGLDLVYPRSHRKLAAEIIEQGALISEYPLGIPPKAENFPKRNRIVSGLSLGVLVIEATLRSGSLITAHLAAEQGREVFAIPGSIYNSLSRGCHFLIRQGAKLVETIEDILEELQVFDKSNTSPSKNNVSKQSEENLDTDYQALLNGIGFELTTIDQLVERTGFATSTIASMVLMLELRGKIVSVPGGYIRNP